MRIDKTRLPTANPMPMTIMRTTGAQAARGAGARSASKVGAREIIAGIL
jgi:hypothetical protein